MNDIEKGIQLLPENEGLDTEGQDLLRSTRKRNKRKDIDRDNDWVKPKNQKLREQGESYKGVKKDENGKLFCTSM